MDTPLSRAHLPPEQPTRVRIRIRPHMGVIGEDRKDWLEEEEHECSAPFARNLVARGIAHVITDPPPSAPEAVVQRDPVIEHGDPTVQSRDPVIEAGEAISKPRVRKPR